MTVAPIKGLAHYFKNEYVPAIDVFERQEKLGNDSYPVHYYLGQCYWHTEVMYRAQEELLAAWQIDSSDVNLAYSIAAVYADSNRSFEKEVKPWLDKAMNMLQPDPLIMFRLYQQYGLGEAKLFHRDRRLSLIIRRHTVTIRNSSPPLPTSPIATSRKKTTNPPSNGTRST